MQVKARKKERVHSVISDVIEEVLKTQNDAQIIFDKEKNKLTIKGDKTYVFLSYKKMTVLFADGDVVRDDIKPSEDLSSEMDIMLFLSALDYEKCEDLKTGNVAYTVRRRVESNE